MVMRETSPLLGSLAPSRRLSVRPSLFYGLDFLPGWRVPEVELAFPVAGGQPSAVGGKGDKLEYGTVSRKCHKLTPSRQIPELDGIGAVATGRQPAAVRRERHRVSAVHMTFECGDPFERG